MQDKESIPRSVGEMLMGDVGEGHQAIKVVISGTAIADKLFLLELFNFHFPEKTNITVNNDRCCELSLTG